MRLSGIFAGFSCFPRIGETSRKVSNRSNAKKDCCIQRQRNGNDWRSALAGLAGIFLASSASAAMYYVSPDGSDASAGTNWATAKQTIEAAVGLVTSGDLVLVTNGTYNTGGSVFTGKALTNRVCVTKDITLQSVNGPDVTFIVGAPDTMGGSASNGSAAVRGIYLADGASLIGFTVTNGYTTTIPGGDQYGGGVYCEAGSVVVSNCVISGNRANYWGGGVYRGTLHNCIISGNTAGDHGGGARNSELYECRIEDNTSGDNGGAMEDGFAERCWLLNNSAAYGGGMANAYATNCVIAGNIAGQGGGVYKGYAHACTIMGNTADIGGGISLSELIRSISYHNVSAGLSDNYDLTSTIQYSCTYPEILSYARTMVYEPPMVSGMNNPHLLVGSPCLDKGTSYGAYDIDGELRTNGTSDYGCDERWPLAVKDELSATIHIPLGTNVVAGYPLGFEALTEGRADRVFWSFDGSETFTNVPLCKHVFTNAGDHTVTLRLTNMSYSAVATAMVHVVSENDGTWYVTPDGHDGAAGRSWATAKQTIQAAVDAATNYAGEIVLVSNGVYSTGGAVAPGQLVTNRVCITSDVFVRSVNGPEVTVIEGAAGSNGSNDVDSVRGVYLVRGSELSGFTVREGFTMDSSTEDGCGGGVFGMGSGAVITNCIISSSVADAAGGGCAGGTYNNCAITGNRSEGNAGGGYGVTLNQCMVSSNSASSGGGMELGYADRCTFLANHALGGGAVYGYRYTSTVLYNSLLVSNVANVGGAAYGENYRCTLNNCTVTGNSATNSDGGGTYYCNLNNSIVYYNTAVSNGQDIVMHRDGEVYYTCASDGVSDGFGGCSTNAPQFVNATDDFRLRMTSPCVDTGFMHDAPTNVSPYDIQGYSRIINTNVDMGAYETPLATVSPTNGPLGGGNLVVMTNVAPAISGITNVLVGSLSATAIPAQGTNWIAFRAPRGAVYGAGQDVVLQSSVADDLDFVMAYTYDAPPSQVYVDANNGDDENNGQNWAQALQTIQSAIDLVATGGVITVTNGVYDTGSAVTPGYTGSNRVTISKALTLQSVNGPDVTSIVGAPGSNGSNDVDSIRGLYAYPGSGLVVINGFTITNGYSCNSGNTHYDKNGGGVFLGGDCVMSNCVVSGNQAHSQAGGVYLFLGSEAKNCRIAGNVANASWGGGVAIYDYGELNNSTIQGNASPRSFGGGILLNAGGDVNNCLVISNSALGAGGGVYGYNGGVLNNSTIADNTADEGGGVCLVNAGELNNCIVCSNWAPTAGADIYATTGVVIRYTCASQSIGSPAWTGAVDCLTNVNPMFVSPENGNYRLQELSPCVNYGNNVYAPTNVASTDLADNTRIFDTVVDLGAYELQKMSQTIAFNAIAPQTYGDTLNPAATADSGLNVAYASSDAQVCTNNGPLLYFVGTGTCSIVASQSGNGLWAQAPSVTQALSVASANLAITGAVAQSKSYDNTMAAVVQGAGLSGVVSGDDVTLIGGTTGVFAQATVGTNLAVTTYMSLGGTDAVFYSVPGQPSLSADITARSLSVTGAVAANKEYDATTAATISGASLSGVLGGDTVNLDNASTGTFLYAMADSNIAVTTYMSVSGADAGNYSLSGQPSLMADITRKSLSVTGAVAHAKVYDGTTSATITNAGLSGVIIGDTVSLHNDEAGIFAQAEVGTNIAVNTAMSIGGGEASNYSLVQPSLMADISAKSVFVTGASASNKVYDKTVAAVVSGATLSGRVGLDNVWLQNTSTGTFSQATIGTNLAVTTYISLTGSDAGNYALTNQPALSADITKKSVSVTSASAQDKEYDSTVSATVSGAMLSGVVSGDTVSLVNASTGTFSQAMIGTNLVVTSYMSIGGVDSGNYTLSDQPSLMANITAKGLLVTNATASNKVYDGTTAATVSGAMLSGVISGDVVSLHNATTGTFATANAGNAISVSTHMTLGGGEAANYMLSQPSLTANILKKNQTITFDPISDTVWSSPVGLSAVSDSGLSVSFNVVSGPASLLGTNVTFSGIGPVEVAASQTGSQNYNVAATITNSFNVTGPMMSLLGTNRLIITNGASPSVTGGTDFGAMTAGSGVITNVFSITNSGTSLMTISGVTTSGASAGLFVVSGVPGTVAAGAVETFMVAFEADSGGVKNAALNFANDGPGSPFVMNLTGAGSGGDIGLMTNRLSFSGIYDGSNPAEQTLMFTNAGISEFTFTNALVYSGDASGWLTVLPASSIVSSGTSRLVTNSVNLSGVGVGTHSCTVSVYAADATNSPQNYVVTLQVVQADQTITFASPGNQITTNRVGLSATADSGLAVTLSVGTGPAALVSGTNLVFSGAGNVVLLAHQTGNANYKPAVPITNVISVTKAMATVVITNLNQTYDGSARSVGAVTAPTGLTVNVTYNGGATAPTSAGNYTVIGTVDHTMYQGARTNTLVVSKANQSIMFLPIPGQVTTNTVGLRATATSGGAVSFGLLSGPGAIADGTNLSFTGAGTVQVTASQSGDGNYNAAPVITNLILVTRSYQRALGFAPSTYMNYMTTNSLMTTGGSGSGAVSYAVSSGPAFLTNNMGLFIQSGTGVVAVVATKASDAMFHSTAATATVFCARADQSIAFPDIGIQVVSNTVGLSAQTTSGLEIQFGVATGPGHVIGTNLTLSATGTVFVTAAQAGNSNWNAAVTVTQEVLVVETPPVGNVSCVINPEGARTLGRWRVDGGDWQSSGALATNLSPGNYEVDFKAAAGWRTPTSVQVTVTYDQTTVCTGRYVMRSVPNDFDSDGISDIGCYAPETGYWYIYKSASSQLWVTNYAGGDGTLPVTGDFDGDAVCDYGTYYSPSGLWRIMRSTSGDWENNFGFEGTVPVTGDLDGDGTLDFGCYYDQTGWWFIYKSASGFWSTQFGYGGTVPVTGDFDGDGIGDFGCYYAPEGWWYIFKSTSGKLWTTQFGYSGTVPVTGDFDGDGIDDFGCYYDMGGNWYLYKSRDGFYTTTFGYTGTVPISGDYDGDGIDDYGCYYAPGGNWYVFMSGSQEIWLNQFGYEGTLPLK